MTTLVTGGAGFIGSHFIELLLERAGDSIVCLDEFNDYYAPAAKRRNVHAPGMKHNNSLHAHATSLWVINAACLKSNELGDGKGDTFTFRCRTVFSARFFLKT